MALFLSHGMLVYTFNVENQRVKLESKEKYNDGTWHDVSSLKYIHTCDMCICVVLDVCDKSFLPLKVIFIRDGNMGKLIIDGLTVLVDTAQGSNTSFHVSSPFYFGGVPPGKAQINIQV